jgi:nascent polypeptide-associated complex subunit alpha
MNKGLEFGTWDVDNDSLGYPKKERKIRKGLAKLGLREVLNVKKISISLTRGHAGVIGNPKIYMIPGSDSYIVFGKIQIHDPNASIVSDKPEQEQEISMIPKESISESIDELEVEEKDIQLIMNQCDVDYDKAKKALQKHDGDIVNAIIWLAG